MSDLSWLNPAPRAIAVYASHPLSPVATQHSLPSGRYSLLAPDFHRLDRTSFGLALAVGTLIAERPPPQMSGARRIHPEIVGWSTAPRGQVINESPGQVPKKRAA